jgi:hypothetical protein
MSAKPSVRELFFTLYESYKLAHHVKEKNISVQGAQALASKEGIVHTALVTKFKSFEQLGFEHKQMMTGSTGARAEWDEAAARDMIAMIKELLPTVELLALSDPNGKIDCGYASDRITAPMLLDYFKHTLENESSNSRRDPGAYRYNPFRGFSPDPK